MAARPRENRAGDIICTPAGERRGHHAAPGHLITHLPSTEAAPGGQRPKATHGEHVTDEEHHQR